MYAYSNNGESMRAITNDMRETGEVLFEVPATEAQLLASFPGRASLQRGRRVRELTQVLERMYDSKAQERQYDNRYTCALRAGYPGPFRSEGLAFAEWMDDCNALGYQIMAQCQAGQRAVPTEEEFLGLMPAMVWP